MTTPGVPGAAHAEPETSPQRLHAALDAVAAARVLLVASDFDGTLSDIAPQPHLARADERDLALLTSLAARAHTPVAILSGRPREQLLDLFGPRPGILLCGSHGGEPDPSLGPIHLEGVAPIADEIRARLEALARAHPGAFLERKPMGLALHYRGCEPRLRGHVREQALAIARGQSTRDDGTGTAPGMQAPDDAQGIGITAIDGDMVVEAVPARVNKGACLRALRGRLAVDAAVFIGDDTTDETVFAVLAPGDVGIRIGPAPTQARFRVPDRSHVNTVLAGLLAART